ncbi:MAG: cytochrome c3 family protein [Dehalococcoidia bacterium]|nr:cytochrome c3 family protein [Dehalococcoidia bacterium]
MDRVACINQRWTYFLALGLLLVAGLWLAAALAEEALAADDQCLACHGAPGLVLTFPSGDKLPLNVDSKAFSSSVHGDKLGCADCHSGYAAVPHPKVKAQDVREYTIALYEVCRKCHFAEYTKTLDSTHFQVFSEGNQWAPTCVDCHGAHNVARAGQPRSGVSQTCSACHQEVTEAYVGSVHGAALEEGNADVPSCTDCHRSHDISDPRTASFRQETPALCVQCHSDKPLMDKYGISTDVSKTYLADFHGSTVALEAKQSVNITPAVAVCTDCHGVHDISRVDDPDSPLIKENLLSVCQKCHPDATANFPGAWLSHYQPSLTKAPLVFLVQVFYRFLIPFMLVGLGLHIGLDLWRAANNR